LNCSVYLIVVLVSLL